MDEKSRINILILDPEQDTAELFTRALETYSNGCKCYWVKTCQEARSLLTEIQFSILLADLSTLEQDHFLLLDALREMPMGTRVIVDAYLNQKEDISKMLTRGVAGYFIKPVKVSALRKLIDDLNSNGHEGDLGRPVILR